MTNLMDNDDGMSTLLSVAQSSTGAKDLSSGWGSSSPAYQDQSQTQGSGGWDAKPNGNAAANGNQGGRSNDAGGWGGESNGNGHVNGNGAATQGDSWGSTTNANTADGNGWGSSANEELVATPKDENGGGPNLIDTSMSDGGSGLISNDFQVEVS